jgi:DNA-binding Lrp family transcriptional regulator
MRILLVNGRASYQSIGDELKLSSNAVKNRVMRMIDEGAIGRFVTQVRLEKFGHELIYALISHGNGQQETIVDRLKLVGDTFMVINCVGDITVFGIAVRGELEQKMELVKRLVDPAIVINMFSIRSLPVKKLMRTDLLLIRHLVKYPRASVHDLAKALKVSTRTVKRRLEFLAKNDIINFSMLYNPAAMRGFIQFSLLLEIEERKYATVVERIYRQLGDHFLLPPPQIYQKNMIVVILYTDNVYSMDEMFNTVKNIDGVRNVELSIPTRIDFKLDWFVNVIDKVLKQKREGVIRQEDYLLAR